MKLKNLIDYYESLYGKYHSQKLVLTLPYNLTDDIECINKFEAMYSDDIPEERKNLILLAIADVISDKRFTKLYITLKKHLNEDYRCRWQQKSNIKTFIDIHSIRIEDDNFIISLTIYSSIQDLLTDIAEGCDILSDETYNATDRCLFPALEDIKTETKQILTDLFYSYNIPYIDVSEDEIEKYVKN